MKNKVKLEFDESGYTRLKEAGLKTGQIVIDAQKELQKLKVPCQVKDLIGGNFLDAFHSYHRKVQNQEKESFVKRLPYEKYIEMLGLDYSKLEELEDEYKIRSARKYEFYARNDRFFVFCENRAARDKVLKEFLDKAPKKIAFTVKELMIIKGNDIQVDLDPELFTLYATNSKQLETMQNARQFVGVSKKLGLDYKYVKKGVETYLFDDSYKPSQMQTGKQGLSYNLEEINFDFNKILAIK